ncbi:MAG: hypothetical protein WHU54_09200 [Candidatus Bathyarchaeia archaeon]
MGKPSNIKDLEFSKFVGSPTRPNEAAVEVVSTQKQLSVESIDNLSMLPNEMVTITTNSQKRLRLVSQKAIRWGYSRDGVEWTKVGIGGWVDVTFDSAFFLKNFDSSKGNSVTIEVLS